VVGDSGKADWTEVNPRILVDLIAEAGKKGGALRFGYTRDGGAYSIGVYIGSEYFTDYIRPSEDVDTYMETLTESFKEFTPEGTARAPQKRSGKR
jgi:hypothetical protein